MLGLQFGIFVYCIIFLIRVCGGSLSRPISEMQRDWGTLHPGLASGVAEFLHDGETMLAFAQTVGALFDCHGNMLICGSLGFAASRFTCASQLMLHWCREHICQ